MSRINLSFRRQCLIGALSQISLPILLALCAVPSHADQLVQHDSLVEKYVNEQHANPLVADCAAHAVFVVSTSNFYDHADFADNALDDQHATVQPWNDAFDNGKQRIKVDTIVSVEGQGFRKTSQSEPDVLKFKCGFFDNKLLAFSYNDPVPPATAANHSKRHGKGSRNGHTAHSTHSSKNTKPATATTGASTTHTSKSPPAHTGSAAAKPASPAKKAPASPSGTAQ